MNDRLTEEQLAQIAARAEQASPGPWHRCYGGEPKEIGHLTKHVATWRSTVADGEFIAAGRADIPALLAHVAALKAEHKRETADLRHERNDLQKRVAELERELAPWRHQTLDQEA